MRVTLSRSLAALIVLTLAPACRRQETTPAAFTMQPARPADPAAGRMPLFTIQLEPPPAAWRGLAARPIEVDDPVYRRAKRYEGVPLADAVDRLAPAGTRAGDEAHLVLVCLDGYRAPLTLGLARKGGAVLASRDLDAAASWEDLPAGTQVKTPAPFYLVWPRSASGHAIMPWPYGVVAVEVWLADPSERARPSQADGAVGKGYRVFVQKCISCHRVNGAGGTLGAELNTPANVTEYWNRAALRQFILEPASIRAGSRMPRLTTLTGDDADAVITYLERMKYEKLAPR